MAKTYEANDLARRIFVIVMIGVGAEIAAMTYILLGM